MWLYLMTTYKTTVEPGDDIRPVRYIGKHDNKDKMVMPVVGTVGCWVEIKTKREPEWTKYLRLRHLQLTAC
jgi:hypothetical protein